MTDSRDPKAADPQRRTLLKGTAGILATGVFPAVHAADPIVLRQQAIITPECGLAAHTPAVAERVHRFAAEVGRRVRDQATASRWVLGA